MILRVVYRYKYRFTTSVVGWIDIADYEAMWADLEYAEKAHPFMEETPTVGDL